VPFRRIGAPVKRGGRDKFPPRRIYIGSEEFLIHLPRERGGYRVFGKNLGRFCQGGCRAILRGSGVVVFESVRASQKRGGLAHSLGALGNGPRPFGSFGGLHE